MKWSIRSKKLLNICREAFRTVKWYLRARKEKFMEEIKTPVLDRMEELKEKSQTCGEFLEWLQGKYAIFRKDETKTEPIYTGVGDFVDTEKILAEFFRIDLKEAEKEKEQLMRSVSGRH